MGGCSCLPPLDIPAGTIVGTDNSGGETSFSGGPGGHFSVSRDGEATYSYPLWTPPGRRGIEPSLALQYGSRNSNGIVGVGWQLSGFPRIERCARTRATDGRNKVVQYDATDVFCLAGQRLVVVKGQYGTAGAEYRTQEDSYSKIVSGPLDSNGLGPQYFQVFQKNGEILSFGIDAASSNSRIEGNQLVVSTKSFIDPTPVVNTSAMVRFGWSLDRTEDRFGNAMRIKYTLSNDTKNGVQQLPSAITYTEALDGSLTPQRSVVFGYEDRTDVFAWYVAGFRQFSDKRLARVTMSAPDPFNSRAVRIYRIVYGVEASSPHGPARSLLEQVQQCDARATSALADGVCSTGLRLQWTPSWRSNEYFDLDTGIHDSTNTSAKTPSVGKLFTSLVPADIDGDGCDDLLIATMDPPTGPPPWPRAWKYLQSSCYQGSKTDPTTILTARTPTPVAVNLPATAQIRAIDMDLDGRTDVIAVGGGAQLQGLGASAVLWPVAIYLAGNDLSKLYTTEIDQQVAINGAGLGDLGTTVSGQLITPMPYVGDINGDGFPDIVTAVPTVADPQGGSTFLWTGSVTHGLIPAQAGCPSPCLSESSPIQVKAATGAVAVGDQNIQLVDIDGDGTNELLLRVQSPDAAGIWTRYLPSYYAFAVDSDGKQSAAPLGLIPGEQINITDAAGNMIPGSIDLFLDVNGDGLPDLVRWPNTGGPLRGPIGNSGRGFDPVVDPMHNEPVIAATASFPSPAFEPDPGVRILDFDGEGSESILFVNCRTTGQGHPVLLTHIQRNAFVASSGDQPSLTAPTDQGGQPLPCADEADDGTVLSQILDVNGDGVPDLVQVVGGELHVYLRMPVARLAEYVIDNGLTTHINYSPLTDPATYHVQNPGVQSQQCAPPACPGSLAVLQKYGVVKGPTVVSSFSVTHPGVGGSPLQFVYSYADGLYDLSAGGWVGFSGATVQDPQTQTTVETTFGTALSYPTTSDPIHSGTVYPEASRPTKLVKRYSLPDGSELDRTVTTQYSDYFNEVSSDSTDQAVTYSTLPNTIVQQQLEGTGVPSLVREMTTVLYYTQYGDLHIATTTTNDGSVDALTIDRLNDTANWLLSMPTSITYQSTSSGTNAATRIEYTPLSARGVPSAVTLAPGLPVALAADQQLNISYSYDAHGQVGKVDMNDFANADHRVLWICRDAVEDQWVCSVTNGLAQVTRFAQYPAFGTTVARMDPNGIEDFWQYDGFGRLKRTALAGEVGTSIAYDGAGFDLATDDGGRTRFNLDSFGGIVETQQAGFNGEPIFTDFSFNDLGLVSEVNGPCVYKGGAPCAFDDLATYDPVGRLTGVIHSDGASRKVAYDKLTATSTDEAGHVSIATTDVLGRLVAISRPADDGHLISISTVIGPFGRPSSLTDPAGTFTFHYDSRGRRTDVFDPDGGHTITAFNAYNQTRHQLNQQNDTIDWHYDPLGRLSSLITRDGTTTFSWDTAVDLAGRNNAIGKLASTLSPSGISTVQSYDVAGRMNSTSWTIDGTLYKLSAIFDQFGRLQNVMYPKPLGPGPPFSVRYCYNGLGFLESVVDATRKLACTSSAKSYWTLQSTNAQGQVASEVFGNGVSATHAFNEKRWFPTELTATQPGAPHPFFGAQYQYNPDGDVKDRYDEISNYDQTFEYDSLDRLKTWGVLVGAPSSFARIVEASESYTLDDAGDLRTRSRFTPPFGLFGATSTTTYGYGVLAGPHAMTSVNADTFGYNPIGELTTAPGRQLSYTAFGLPSSVSINGAPSVTFRFDAFGTRVGRYGSGGDVTISIGDLYEQRRTAAGAATDIFLLKADDRVIAQIQRDPLTGNATTRYLHADIDGSIRAITDDAASPAVTELRGYDPFGAPRDPTDPWLTAPFPVSDVTRGFLGRPTDADLGYVDLGARLYDPATTHFLSEDPVIGSPDVAGSLNPYVYGFANPTRWRDPTGLCAGPTLQYETVVCGEASSQPGRQFFSFEPTVITVTVPRRQPTAMAAGPAARADDSGTRKPSSGTDVPPSGPTRPDNSHGAVANGKPDFGTLALLASLNPDRAHEILRNEGIAGRNGPASINGHPRPPTAEEKLEEQNIQLEETAIQGIVDAVIAPVARVGMSRPMPNVLTNSPLDPTSIQNPAALGAKIGAALKDLPHGKIAAIGKQITALGLSQGEASIATEAAVHALALDTLVDAVGDKIVVAMIVKGVNRSALAINAAGEVFQVWVDVVGEEGSGILTITNLRVGPTP